MIPMMALPVAIAIIAVIAIISAAIVIVSALSVLPVMVLFCFALTDITVHLTHGHVLAVLHGDSGIILLQLQIGGVFAKG